MLEPVAGVTGGHTHNGAALCDGFQNGLKHRRGVVGITGAAAAQGQVHRVGTQQNGIFNGNNVVGIISAAGLAEHLHDKNLGIRGNALRQNGLQSIGIRAVTVGNVAVSGSDSGDVGAMVTLGIVVVGNVQIPVDVVKAKGNLGVYV